MCTQASTFLPPKFLASEEVTRCIKLHFLSECEVRFFLVQKYAQEFTILV